MPHDITLAAIQVDARPLRDVDRRLDTDAGRVVNDVAQQWVGALCDSDAGQSVTLPVQRRLARAEVGHQHAARRDPDAATSEAQ